MTQGRETLCFSCARFRPGTGTCEAYPDGVPGEIIDEGFDHRKPFGDEKKDPTTGMPLLYKENK